MIEEIQKTIAREKDEIRRSYKAVIRGIFGSYARGDFGADSDLDLLVDFDDGAGLLDLVGLGQYLEDVLGCKVDVVSRRSLREELRASVLDDTIHL
ncbi:MAG: nucleotidyltransferase domain-containing protein [Candidatus Poribacteria bacterium]|nr:nucleotidyltransferase domain-containing protein [Candidatus Poribacteria bacterium]